MAGCREKPLPDNAEVLQLLGSELRRLKFQNCQRTPALHNTPREDIVKTTIMNNRNIWQSAQAELERQQAWTAQIVHDMGTPVQARASGVH